MKSVLIFSMFTLIAGFSHAKSLDTGKTKMSENESDSVVTLIESKVEKSDDGKYEFKKIQLYKKDKVQNKESFKAKLEVVKKKGAAKISEEIELDERDTEVIKGKLLKYSTLKENRKSKKYEVKSVKCDSKTDCSVEEDEE